MTSRQTFLFIFLIPLLLREGDTQATCPNTPGGNNVGDVANTRTDFITTFATDDTFLIVGPAGVVNCYGYIEEWEWYYGDQAGTCSDITFQVWRPVDVTTMEYVLVAQNILIAGVDWQCGAGGGVVNKVMFAGLPIPVIPGDVYGWRDTVGDRRPMEFDEAILPGSGYYGTTLTLSSFDTCAYTTGTTCSWLSTFSGGQADLWSRSFALNARIADLNFRPYWDNLVYNGANRRTDVYENAEAGTFVFQVIADYDYNAQQIVQPEMNYRLTNAAPAADCTCKFEIDAYSGNITVIEGVDFEGSTTCTLTVEAWFGTISDTEQLVVDIIDVNEPHDINNLHDDIAIDAATTTAGTRLFTVTETDPDGGAWPNQQYRMTNSLPYFDLFQLGTPTADDISATQALANYGSFGNYTLSLTSYDPYHISGPKNLRVFIYNTRIKPVLTNVPATVTVLETSATAGTVIFDVDGAAQPDGRGDPLSYAITAVYPIYATGLFGINAANGQISHIANPGFDFFTLTQYKIEVTCTDGDGLFTSDPYNVTVEIMWVNTPPVFSSASFAATIPEKESVGTEVPGILLDGSDRDVVIGDWIFYNTYQADAYRFWPSNDTHKVYVNHVTALGPGVASVTYPLTVQVQDQFGELAIVPLTITVTDINDHKPVFSPDTYIGQVTENDFGSVYTGVTVTATDDDAGNNANIRYKIEGEIPNLYFEVDATGRITLKQPISYHEYPNMTFTVLAEDGGDPVLCDNATVTIHVIEVNNNRPRFNNNFYNLEIRSDLAEGTPVLTVNATDNDTDTVNGITYMFIVLQDDFGIGTESGTIIIERDLNHYNTFLLYIYAKDNGVPNLYSDPLHVRIDTYDADQQLVDIRLKMPLKDFLQQQDAFEAELEQTLSPWNVEIEGTTLDGDQTLVSIYAMKNKVPDSTDYVSMKKEFVHKKDILAKLRTGIQGNPSSALRGAQYAEYQPTLVEPTSHNWMLDSPGGIALTVLLTLLIPALLIAGFLLLAKYKGWLCFAKPKRKRIPAAPQGGPKDDFKLRYDLPKKPGEDEIARNVAMYGGAGGAAGAAAAGGLIVPISPPQKSVYTPQSSKSRRNPMPITRGDQYASTRRTPHAEGMRSLTPVNLPDSQRASADTVTDLRHS